jgi:hypothetical protein
MSFSFTANGTPTEAIAEVGKQAANQPGVPTGFSDSVNQQLSGLPEHAEVTVSCHGHTGTNPGQMQGNISLQAQIDWRIQSAQPVEQIVDADPAVQPGPERFPEGFSADAPAGAAAGEPEDDDGA